MEGNILDMGVSDNQLGVTTAAKAHLKSSAGWAQFMAIMFFIFGGLILIVALIASVSVGSLGLASDFPAYAAGRGVGVFLVYGVMGGLYILIGLYLMRFANKTKRAVMANDSVLLEQGLNNLKRYLTVMGVLMIIAISLVVLGVLFGLGAAMMSGY